jgi:hypothetical protein
MSVIEDNPGIRPSNFTDAQREERIQRARERRAETRRLAAAPETAPNFPKVIRFKVWCALVGISEAVGRRLVDKGKVRVTRLSERCIGVTEAEHQRYLAACEQSS